jgi:hypothetical protein
LQRDFEGRHRKAISEDGFSLVPASATSALHIDFPEASQRAAAAAAGIPAYSYQTKCRNVTASDTPFHVFIRSLISWQLSPKQVLKPSATATAGRSGDCLVQRNCPIGQIPYVERTEFLSNGTRRVIEFPNLAELRALGRSQIIGQCLKVTKLSELASLHFQLDVMSYVGELGEGCSALGGKSACFQVQTRELSFSLKNAAGIVILPK